MKIAIAGIPKSGKTTYADKMGNDYGDLALKVYHTDDLIGQVEWSELSQQVSTWFNNEGDFIIEGVAVPRALRKWLANNEEGKPCDKVIWMGKAKIELSKGQLTMGKGCVKVMKEIKQELINRGVEIEEG